MFYVGRPGYGIFPQLDITKVKLPCLQALHM